MRARAAMIIILAAGAGCGDDGGPRLTPTVISTPSFEEIVRSSAPTGFLTTTTGKRPAEGGFDAVGFRSRFFQNGPTDALRIMHEVDERLSRFRTTAADNLYIPCASATPVSYAIHTPDKDITMVAQCYEKIGAGLIQWGMKDGVTYIWISILGDGGGVAAIARPVGSSDGGLQRHDADIWASVGASNATGCDAHTWHGCSYGIMHIDGNSATRAFEMAVAGIGFGFCGAQVRSDGTNLYAKGSIDPDCTIGALCTAAHDINASGACDSLMSFALPALGRKAISDGSFSAAPSKYPATPNVTLDGKGHDAVILGPTTPTAGVMEFSFIRIEETGTSTDGGP